MRFLTVSPPFVGRVSSRGAGEPLGSNMTPFSFFFRFLGPCVSLVYPLAFTFFPYDGLTNASFLTITYLLNSKQNHKPLRNTFQQIAIALFLAPVQYRPLKLNNLHQYRQYHQMVHHSSPPPQVIIRSIPRIPLIHTPLTKMKVNLIPHCLFFSNYDIDDGLFLSSPSLPALLCPALPSSLFFRCF